MCGLHWYKQELERADGDNKKLDELKQMMEQRFHISEGLPPDDNDVKSSGIIAVYNEIIARKV